MRELKGLLVVLITGVCLVSSPAGAQPVEPSEKDPRTLFFEALDLKEAGDWEGAIARFQLAHSGDASLVQSILHVAECFHELRMPEEALAQAEAYLEAGFEMAEVNRARELILRCRWEIENGPPVDGEDPATVAVEPTSEGNAAEPDAAAGQPDTEPVAHLPVGSAAFWAPVTVEAGAGLDHFANTAGLTTFGPLFGVRIAPTRWIEITGRAQLGLGGYEEGTVRVPGFAIGVGGSLPFGRVRVHFGGQMPMVLSGYGGQNRLDVGVGGEVGVRVALGEGRIVIGGQVGGGYLVKPFVGGSIRLGVQLGELR